MFSDTKIYEKYFRDYTDQTVIEIVQGDPTTLVQIYFA